MSMQVLGMAPIFTMQSSNRAEGGSNQANKARSFQQVRAGVVMLGQMMGRATVRTSMGVFSHLFPDIVAG